MTLFDAHHDLRDEIASQQFEDGYFAQSPQMYHDFRRVLLDGGAEAAQCRRVFAAICLFGGVGAAMAQYVTDDKGAGVSLDPHATMAQVGKTDLVNQIIRVMCYDPTGRVQPATSYAEEEEEDHG